MSITMFSKPGQPPQPTTDASGRPIRPEFNSILRPNGELRSPYSAEYRPMEVHTMSANMSPWLNLQNERIGQQSASMRDQLSGDTQMGLGTGMSSLAASGGLDSGSRERLMTSSAADRTRGLTGINQQASASRLDAGIQAELMRRQTEQFNTNAKNAGSQFNASAFNNNQQFNTANAIGGVGMQNAFNQGVYSDDMQAWGANMTAEAQRKAAQKSPKWYESFFTNVQDGSWRPFGIGGSGALGKGDALGNAFDKVNPVSRWTSRWG